MKNLRLSESEYEKLLERNMKTPARRTESTLEAKKSVDPMPISPEEKPLLQTKKKLVLVLPFKLPTWNSLLAMDQWKRKKVRDWLHNAVLSAIPREKGWQTQTESVLRPSLTELCLLEYYQMMTAGTSKKSATAKKRPTTTRHGLR